MANSYLKQLIECTCILPQMQNKEPTVFHKFVVFSEIKPDGTFKPHYSKCNNCDAIHKVIEVGISKRINKETVSSIITKEEVAATLPDNLTELLKIYKLDLPTYQEISFIFENKQWPKTVILSKEYEDGVLSGKLLKIFSDKVWKVDSFFYDENGDDELDDDE